MPKYLNWPHLLFFKKNVRFWDCIFLLLRNGQYLFIRTNIWELSGHFTQIPVETLFRMSLVDFVNHLSPLSPDLQISLTWANSHDEYCSRLILHRNIYIYIYWSFRVKPNLSLPTHYSKVSSNLVLLTKQVLQAHRDEVWFLQFSNNGKYLASSSNDRSAIIWEVIFSFQC